MTAPQEFQRDRDLDWTSLFAAFREAFEWALDVAVAIARDYPDEVEAVERVRTFMRARIAGEMSHVRVDDVLFAFGLLMAAIERDLGPIAAAQPRFPHVHVVSHSTTAQENDHEEDDPHPAPHHPPVGQAPRVGQAAREANHAQ